MSRKYIDIGPEELVTTRGTIIPQAVRFTDGTIVVCYHLANDAAFSPVGASIRHEGVGEWETIEPPAQRLHAVGSIGDDRALFFTQYLFRTNPGEYACLYGETTDAGRSFAPAQVATFRIDGVLDAEYVPRDQDDPDYWYRPQIPEYYRAVAPAAGAIMGPSLFGRVIRLPDGALAVTGMARMQGNMTRPRRADYIPPPKGVAESETETLMSALFFRSEDEGRTWQGHVIANPTPDLFGVGLLHSEGLNETGIEVTADGNLFALMRQGHCMHLYWTRSVDGGRTWDHPRMFNYPGVAPALHRMPCGALAAAWGRPGMTVAFDTDGMGDKWDLMANFEKSFPSQEYACLVGSGHRSVLLFYDRRKWDADNRRFYDHGIYCRSIDIDFTRDV